MRLTIKQPADKPASPNAAGAAPAASAARS
jgi:hypothetical protein